MTYFLEGITMAKKDTIYLTQEGIDKLKEELDDLVSNKRREIAKALKEARELGDLSENSSWDDAKDRQVFIENRISEIEHILKNAKPITSKAGGVVALGSKVKVELETGEQEFHIVGSTEADIDAGKISYESPIAKALIGKTKGDEVEVDVPAGTMKYIIKSVD